MLKTCLSVLALSCASFAVSEPARADATYAYCEFIPYDVELGAIAMPCIFSQRQGAVGITWQDDVHSRFVPDELESGVLEDERGGRVYRNPYAIEDGIQFEMEAGFLNVYWGGASGGVNWGNIDWDLAPQTPWGL